jgi:hypothetical protein
VAARTGFEVDAEGGFVAAFRAGATSSAFMPSEAVELHDLEIQEF